MGLLLGRLLVIKIPMSRKFPLAKICKAKRVARRNDGGCDVDDFTGIMYDFVSAVRCAVIAAERKFHGLQLVVTKLEQKCESLGGDIARQKLKIQEKYRQAEAEAEYSGLDDVLACDEYELSRLEHCEGEFQRRLEVAQSVLDEQGQIWRQHVRSQEWCVAEQMLGLVSGVKVVASQPVLREFVVKFDPSTLSRLQAYLEPAEPTDEYLDAVVRFDWNKIGQLNVDIGVKWLYVWYDMCIKYHPGGTRVGWTGVNFGFEMDAGDLVQLLFHRTHSMYLYDWQLGDDIHGATRFQSSLQDDGHLKFSSVI
jgi:hypothetical protein